MGCFVAGAHLMGATAHVVTASYSPSIGEAAGLVVGTILVCSALVSLAMLYPRRSAMPDAVSVVNIGAATGGFVLMMATFGARPSASPPQVGESVGIASGLICSVLLLASVGVAATIRRSQLRIPAATGRLG